MTRNFRARCSRARHRDDRSAARPEQRDRDHRIPRVHNRCSTGPATAASASGDTGRRARALWHVAQAYADLSHGDSALATEGVRGGTTARPRQRARCTCEGRSAASAQRPCGCRRSSPNRCERARELSASSSLQRACWDVSACPSCSTPVARKLHSRLRPASITTFHCIASLIENLLGLGARSDGGSSRRTRLPLAWPHVSTGRRMRPG